MKVKDGMTAAQHNLILSRMEECLLIDPADLLVEDRQLLDADFNQLTRGPTSDKFDGWQKWTQLGARQITSLRGLAMPSDCATALDLNLG
jgi:hypothetical protein